MAYPTAQGVESFSGTYIPEVWSTKLLVKFYEGTALTEVSNTDYEGEIRLQGSRICAKAGSLGQRGEVPCVSVTGPYAPLHMGIVNHSHIDFDDLSAHGCFGHIAGITVIKKVRFAPYAL